jgi:outer membrane protein assembly factor BamB
MFNRKQGQRRGRVFHWVAGALSLCITGLIAYQWWNTRERQKQNDEHIEELKTARLDPVKSQPADPKDWPQWRGPHRDGTASGDDLSTRWPADGLKQLWKQPGGGGFSALSVAGSRIITLIQQGDNESDGKEVVLCLDAETGKENWRHSYESYFWQDGVGPRATPTIEGDLVWTLGARGHLHCLKVDSGKEVWHHDLKERFNAPVQHWGFASSPLVEGDLLLLNPGGPGNTVVALDKKTGKVKWKNLDEPAGYSAPVISEACGVRQVLFFLAEALVSLDPKTGQEYWRYPWPTPNKVNAATPIVRGDYVFISSGYGKGCALVKVVNGKNGRLRAEMVYENNLMRNHFGSSIFYKDYLYGFDEGFLTCMPFREGKKRGWRAWKERKFNKGTLILAGDTLIVLGEHGNLAMVEPYPGEYRELATFSVTKARCWTMPVVAQGRLYIRDEQSIYCFDLRKN